MKAKAAVKPDGTLALPAHRPANVGALQPWAVGDPRQGKGGYEQRHRVKAGMTGWAQVNGRNAISWEEKFALDVWYVDQRSFLLDLRILRMTLTKVFRKEGISETGQATMSKFMGSPKNEK